jgi:hypothetical protein
VARIVVLVRRNKATSHASNACKRVSSETSFPKHETSLERSADQQKIFTHPQIATSKVGRGGHRKPARAFTEHGAIQAANVLKSEHAVQMGVYVVRAFVRLRELLSTNKLLAERLSELERKYVGHDKAIASVLSSLRQLLHSPETKPRGIGFTANLD